MDDTQQQTLQEFFAADPIPQATQAEPTRTRKKRTPRQPPAAAAPTTEKKKRGPKPAGDKRVRTAKIEIGAALHALAGLNEDEVAMVIAAANKLSALPKKSRGRIVAALARMFQ